MQDGVSVGGWEDDLLNIPQSAHAQILQIPSLVSVNNDFKGNSKGRLNKWSTRSVEQRKSIQTYGEPTRIYCPGSHAENVLDTTN